MIACQTQQSKLHFQTSTFNLKFHAINLIQPCLALCYALFLCFFVLFTLCHLFQFALASSHEFVHKYRDFPRVIRHICRRAPCVDLCHSWLSHLAVFACRRFSVDDHRHINLILLPITHYRNQPSGRCEPLSLYAISFLLLN